MVNKSRLPCLSVCLAALPIYISAILPSAGELLAQLDTGEHAVLALHIAHEPDDSMHAPGHIDQVPDIEIADAPAGGREGRHGSRGGRVLVQHRAQTVARAGIGDGGEGAGGEGAQG